jgi:hypothetical protein
MDKPINRYFVKSCKNVYGNVDSFLKLKDDKNFNIDEGLIPI